MSTTDISLNIYKIIMSERSQIEVSALHGSENEEYFKLILLPWEKDIFEIEIFKDHNEQCNKCVITTNSSAAD